MDMSILTRGGGVPFRSMVPVRVPAVAGSTGAVAAAEVCGAAASCEGALDGAEFLWQPESPKKRARATSGDFAFTLAWMRSSNGRAPLERGDDGLTEGLRAGAAAYIAGEGLAFGVDLLEGGLDLSGRCRFIQVVQHQDGGLEQGGGVGFVLAGDVRGGAVDGF